MPKTREQIKHDPVIQDQWRDNRTQVLWFDPRKIKPMGEHILVELDPPEMEHKSESVIIPESCNRPDIGTRTGTVLAVGPGKTKYKSGPSWMLTKISRERMVLKPGDRVVIGHYSDWESWQCLGEQGKANIVLCQQNDCRLYSEGAN